MDIGFIVAPCSRLGRAGSLSHAGGRHRNFRCWPQRLPQPSRGAHTYGRALVCSAGQGGERRRWREVGYGGGGRGRERLWRGNFRWAISSQDGSTWKGLSGNFGGAEPGRADAAVPERGQVPRCARQPAQVPSAPASILPAPHRAQRKEKSTSLPRYRSTFLYHAMLFCHCEKGFKITLCR